MQTRLSFLTLLLISVNKSTMVGAAPSSHRVVRFRFLSSFSVKTVACGWSGRSERVSEHSTRQRHRAARIVMALLLLLRLESDATRYKFASETKSFVNHPWSVGAATKAAAMSARDSDNAWRAHFISSSKTKQIKQKRTVPTILAVAAAPMVRP